MICDNPRALKDAYLWDNSSTVDTSNSDGISLVLLSSSVISSLAWHNEFGISVLIY